MKRSDIPWRKRRARRDRLRAQKEKRVYERSRARCEAILRDQVEQAFFKDIFAQPKARPDIAEAIQGIRAHASGRLQ